MTKLSRKDLADYYLKDNEQYPYEYLCSICMSPLVTPVKCETCVCTCCLSCAQTWKKSKDLCPFRCKAGAWKTIAIQPIKLDFRCFHCKQTMNTTIQDLIKHIEICNKNPQAMRMRKLRRDFTCGNGHQLKMIQSFYTTTTKDCVECDEGMVKSQCILCKTFFCIKCRPLKCSKVRCSQGHQLTEGEVIKQCRVICDFCGLQLTPSSKYKADSYCNIVSCMPCLNNLPDTLDYKCQQVHQAKCPAFHQLTLRSTQTIKEIKQPCSLCLKVSTCYQQCQKCKEIYCKSCRPLQIKNFKFISGEVSYRLYENKQNTLHRCFECERMKEVVYRQRVKGITFCRECVFQIHISIDQKVPQILPVTKSKCQQQHSIIYFKNQNSTLKICSKCNQKKEVKLFCITCDPVNYFCLKCCEVDSKYGCPSGHTLYPSSSSQAEKCMRCEERSRELVCEDCDFKICQVCCDIEDVQHLQNSAQIFIKDRELNRPQQ